MFLARSPQIRCLAVMALAQGLSTNLIEVVWKNHLHMLHPSPAAYSVRASLALPCLPTEVVFLVLSDLSLLPSEEKHQAGGYLTRC